MLQFEREWKYEGRDGQTNVLGNSSLSNGLSFVDPFGSINELTITVVGWSNLASYPGEFVTGIGSWLHDY